MSWGPSPEYADWWYAFSWKGLIWSAVIATAAAGAIAVFTMLQFWSDGIRDSKSDARIAELNNDAERLKSDNLALRAKVLELESQQAPRRLAFEQQNRIAVGISGFKGQKFTSGAYGDDLESRGLWTTIDAALVKGGWEPVGHTMFAGVALIVGIDVEIAPSMTGTEVQFAAQALVEALIKEGMKANIDISRTSHDAEPGVIHVLVGKKPL